MLCSEWAAFRRRKRGGQPGPSLLLLPNLPSSFESRPLLPSASAGSTYLAFKRPLSMRCTTVFLAIQGILKYAVRRWHLDVRGNPAIRQEYADDLISGLPLPASGRATAMNTAMIAFER